MNWFSRMFRRSAPDLEVEPDGLDWPQSERVRTVTPDKRNPDLSPAFSTSANSIDHRRRPNAEQEQQRVMRQAFMPSQPVQDIALFAGRTQLLRRVIRAIQDQHMHVVVYGDRGIGKTSLLHVVRELAAKANYVVSYTSCGEDTDFCETMRTILARIPLLYDGEYNPAASEVERGGTLADRLPAGPLTVAQISDALVNVQGTRALIVLDEFDRTRSDKFRNAIAELIKNLSDRSIRVQLLVAGVASNLTDLIAHVPSIRRNIIGIGVPNMTNDEVRDLLDIGLKSGRLTIDDAAAEHLVAATGGLPYLAALLGQHAAIACSEAGEKSLTVAHVNAAIALAAEDIGSRLSPLARHVASQPGAITSNSPLAHLARESVHNGGVLNDPATGKRIEALGELGAQMFAQIEGDPLEGWHFREDGVSTYVWLRTMAS